MAEPIGNFFGLDIIRRGVDRVRRPPGIYLPAARLIVRNVHADLLHKLCQPAIYHCIFEDMGREQFDWPHMLYQRLNKLVGGSSSR